MISQVGCGSCHIIPGLERAKRLAGPPPGFCEMKPQDDLPVAEPAAIVRGNAMPDMGLDYGQARDIAAYLYTLD